MSIRPLTRFDDATGSRSNVDLMQAVVLAAAAAWVVYALGTPLVFDLRNPEFNPLIVLALILGSISAYYLVRGVRRRRVTARFGTTVFDQEGSNVYVGETLRGRVITSRPLSAPDGFELRVRCIEGKGETMDEKSRRAHDAILWEASHTAHTANSHGGIPVEFPIPVSALADAKFDSPNWTLKVSATVDGKPFEAVFSLRVYGGSRAEDEADDAEAERQHPGPDGQQLHSPRRAHRLQVAMTSASVASRFCRTVSFAASLVTLAALSISAQSPAAQARPNVVLIVMDDLGYGDIGSYGVTDAKTPNLDRLARAGVRLTDFYANGPNCSPTRTGLISGRYQQRYGIEQPIPPGNTEIGLLPSETSLPRLLKTAGYVTGLVGKWHVGTGPQFRPGRHGFDEFWGFLGSTADYYRHGWAGADAAGRIDPEKLTSALFHNDEPVTYDGYLTDGITLNAKRFLEARQPSAPFFLEVTYNAPHFPFQGPNLPPGQRDRREPLREGTRAEYVAMVEHADKGIGEILALLDTRKLAANTIVVFTSDNGGEWLSRNAPFFNRKSSLWEGGIRVPLLVRWPGHMRPGSVSRHVGMTMDLTASIIAAAGVTPPSGYRPDGIDLFPSIEKGTTIDRTLFWRVNANGFVQKAVRRGDFKFLQEGSGTVEGYHEFLFDLTTDPGERHDLSQTQPARLRELRQLVAGWDAEVTAEFKQR